MAINLKWISEVNYHRKEYLEAVNNAIESLRHFELIEYIHVESICTLINKALIKLNLDDTCQISTSNIFCEGKDSKALEEQFKSLQNKALPPLLDNNLSIDEHLLDLSKDKRLGISLIIRPSEEINRLLARVQNNLQKISPNQHFYDQTEYHVTVMALISANQTIDIKEIPTEMYENVFSNIISEYRPFRIHFRGIGLTEKCILAHGFFQDETLNGIRNDIRKAAPELGLNGQIEDRYPNISAHLTLARFRSKENLKEIVKEIEKMQFCELGVCHVDKIDFVVNDWYMTKDKVKNLASFSLR